MSALCLPITLLGADGDSVDSGDGGDSVYDEEEASARQAEAEHRRSEHRRSDELPTLEEPCLTCILLDSELRTLRQRWHASELKIGELERLLTESRTRNEMLESRVTRFESDLAALRVTTKHVKRCLDQEDRRLGDRDGKYLTATLSDRLVQEVNNRIHFEEQAKLNKRKADFLEHCVEHRDWLEDTLASLTEFVQAFHSEDNETFKNAAECVDELAKHKSWKTCLEALRQPVARLGSAMTAKLVHRDQTELAALIEYCEEQFGPHGVCFPPDDDQSFKLAAKVNGLEADLNGLAKDYEAQAQLTRYFLTVAQQFSARAADAQNQRAQELLAGSDLLSRVFDAAFAPVPPLKYPIIFGASRAQLRQVLAQKVPEMLLDPDLWPHIDTRFPLSHFIADLVQKHRLTHTEIFDLDDLVRQEVGRFSSAEETEAGTHRYSIGSGYLARAVVMLELRRLERI